MSNDISWYSIEFKTIDKDGNDWFITSCNKKVLPRVGETINMPFQWDYISYYGTRAFVVEEVLHHLPTSQTELSKVPYDNIVIYCKPINVDKKKITKKFED